MKVTMAIIAIVGELFMPAADTTVCYESEAFPGIWLSDYSVHGYCTFGMPLDAPTPDWNHI